MHSRSTGLCTLVAGMERMSSSELSYTQPWISKMIPPKEVLSTHIVRFGLFEIPLAIFPYDSCPTSMNQDRFFRGSLCASLQASDYSLDEGYIVVVERSQDDVRVAGSITNFIQISFSTVNNVDAQSADCREVFLVTDKSGDFEVGGILLLECNEDGA